MPDHASLSRFSRSLWLTLVVFAIFAIVFVIYVRSEKHIDRANELRYQSRLLAGELRQSSDDLTRMARSYIATGDPRFKQHYQEVLDIRDGKKPRPINYQDIYWDLVLQDDQRPRPVGAAVDLLETMKKSGFTAKEFAQLATAKANSDRLTSTEFAAMKLIEASETNREEALRMLHDAAYFQAKADIMRPLGEFFRMVEQRTSNDVKSAERTATLMRDVFVLFGLLLLFMLWYAYRSLHAVLGTSVDELHASIARIGLGDFSTEVVIPPNKQNSVLGWVSETRTKLAKLDRDNKEAEAQNRRLTQLYAALSQCNQAIVRCTTAAELFSQICCDAVTVGGMKMAWIGLLDAESQQLNPVASFGTGMEYLEQIHISINADLPEGRGPAGTSVREDRPYWCQDFQDDPGTQPWHERGEAYGWKAVAALPLHRGGQVIGTFILYAVEVNAFDQAAQKLLLEMCMDIDYALDHLALEDERKLIKKKLQQSEESSRLVLENSLDAIINIDPAGNVIEWSGAARHMFGYTREEALGRALAELIIPESQREKQKQGLDRLLLSKKPGMSGRRIELEALRHDGTHFPAEVSIAQIHREEGEFFSFFIRDITERKAAEARIQYLAHFDSLTNLPNRASLEEHVKYATSLAKRTNDLLSLMFLDLDHFKNINDTLGHSIGDALLVELAKRLRLVLREEDTVSRLGGDEFILALPGTDARGAALVAQKILEAVALPYEIGPYELTITASIGIALYPADGINLESLLRSADIAMYRAKQENRNGFSFFTAEMQARSARHLELENALHHAIARNQFDLHYQPQVSLQDGRIIGAEALLRWHHPELGNVSPMEFIQIAEDTGLIISIGEWVLRQSIQQAKTWLDNGIGPLVISVNLSAVQFRHHDLPDLVARILGEVGLAPEYLELELTEGVAMHDPQRAITVMNDLHERGVRMSIDDFGTGYSSLSYLKKFKVYKLKIDQSFVRDISTDSEDKAIVSAIISMASSLGLKTIAEGVETIGQLEFLKNQGCNEVQGYFYSKPLPGADFESFHKTRQK